MAHSSEWQTAYDAAVLEVDNSKLSEKLKDAEAAISRRTLLLSSNSEHSAEHEAMQKALVALGVLRRERLDNQDLSLSEIVAEQRSELLYPKWQAEFQAAIIELEPQALAIRIAAAEILIEKRLREIVHQFGHSLERLAIADALSALQALKRET
jgi:hypothetical protein